MHKALLLVASLGLFLTACTPPGMVDLLPGPGILVEPEWLAGNMERGDVVVVHVASSRDHYEEGHLPGAYLLDLEDIIESPGNLLNVLPDEETISNAFESAGVSVNSHVVLYGDLGGLAATRAFFTLDVTGHDRVSLLNGGRDAWVAAGYNLETNMPEPDDGHFSAEIQEEVVVDADWVEENREDERYLLLDARPPDQYRGDTPGEDISRPGHIPGARNLFWQNTLETNDVRSFRDIQHLAAMFEEAGLDSGQTVVVYCRTGMQASHLYFTARLLGQSVRMYDGSFHDWSNNTEYPVERG